MHEGQSLPALEQGVKCALSIYHAVFTLAVVRSGRFVCEYLKVSLLKAISLSFSATPYQVSGTNVKKEALFFSNLSIIMCSVYREKGFLIAIRPFVICEAAMSPPIGLICDIQ